jgi:hypothetical protein
MGPSALADPELATHLNLTRAQRSTVFEKLDMSRSIREQTVLPLIGLMEFQGKNDEFGRDIAEVARQEKQRVEAEIDWMVWGVLTPSQRNEVNRILGVNIREPQQTPVRDLLHPRAGNRGSSFHRRAVVSLECQRAWNCETSGVSRSYGGTSAD